MLLESHVDQHIIVHLPGEPIEGRERGVGGHDRAT